MTAAVLPIRSPDDRVRAAAVGLAVDAVTVEVVRAFDAAALPSLLLKGPATALWLYDRNEVRAYGDTDLLVPRERLLDARRVLGELGFSFAQAGARADELTPHAEEWRRPYDAASVDLHWTLLQISADSGLVWELLSSASESISVAGLYVKVPKEAARCLIVALKAIEHGVASERSILDLARAVAQVSLDTWQQCVAMASVLDATELLAAALGLVPSGQGLAQELGLAPVRDPRLLLKGLIQEPGERDNALMWARLYAEQGLRAKVRFLRLSLAPSRYVLDEYWSDGRNGQVALARAYLRRLVANLHPGLGAWQRALREAGEATAADRVEILAWSVLVRVLVGIAGVRRTIRVLDAFPRRQSLRPFPVPSTEVPVRTAGRCLHKSLAWSQFLRSRGQAHEIVLGVAGPVAAFQAHAWLAPFETPPPGFVAMQRISR